MQFFKKHKKIVGILLLVAVITAATVFPQHQAEASWWPFSWSTTGAVAGAAGTVAAVVAGAPLLPVLTIGGAITWALFGAGSVVDFAQGSVGWITEHVIYTVTWAANLILSNGIVILGKLLDAAIANNLTIHKTIQNTSAIAAGWKLIRDLANMIFIFYLLYIAIGTMLQLNGVDAKRAVPQIIIAALLVNFSMFMSGLLIDGSNILVSQFYDAITTNGKYPITDIFTEKTGVLQLIENTKSENAAAAENTDKTKNTVMDSVLHAIVTTIVLFVVARFLFTTGLLFLGRLIAFIFLTMLSPFAVLGSSLPFVKQYETKWWTMMLNQAILGPFIMFVLWFALSIFTATGGLAASGKASAESVAPGAYLAQASGAAAGAATTPSATAPTGGGAGSGKEDATADIIGFLRFAVLIGILVFGTDQAKQLSGEVGSGLLELGRTVAGTMGGAMLAGVAVTGSATVGLAGRSISNLDSVKAMQGSKNRTTQALGNFISGAGTYASKATFDPRNIPGVGQYVNQGFGYVTQGGTLGAAVNAGGIAAQLPDNDALNRQHAGVLANLRGLKENKGSENTEARYKATTGYVASQKSKADFKAGYTGLRTDEKAYFENQEEKAFIEKAAEGTGITDDAQMQKLRAEFINKDNLDDKGNLKDAAALARKYEFQMDTGGRGNVTGQGVRDMFASYQTSNIARIDREKSQMELGDIKAIKSAKRDIVEAGYIKDIKAALERRTAGVPDPDTVAIENNMGKLRRGTIANLPDEMLTNPSVMDNLTDTHVINAIAFNNEGNTETPKVIARYLNSRTDQKYDHIKDFLRTDNKWKNLL